MKSGRIKTDRKEREGKKAHDGKNGTTTTTKRMKKEKHKERMATETFIE